MEREDAAASRPAEAPPTIRSRTTVRGLFTGMALLQLKPPTFYILGATFAFWIWNATRLAAPFGLTATVLAMVTTTAVCAGVIPGVVVAFLVLGLLTGKFKLGEDWHYTFSDDFVLSRGLSTETKIAWKGISKIYETPRRFFFSRSGFIGSHVSKEDADAETIARVRAVIRARCRLLPYRPYKLVLGVGAFWVVCVASVALSSGQHTITQSMRYEVLRSPAKVFLITRDDTRGFAHDLLDPSRLPSGHAAGPRRSRIQVFEINATGVTMSTFHDESLGSGMFFVQEGALHLAGFGPRSHEPAIKALQQGKWVDAPNQGPERLRDAMSQMTKDGWERVRTEYPENGASRIKLQVGDRTLEIEATVPPPRATVGTFELRLHNAPGPSSEMLLAKVWVGTVDVSRSNYLRFAWDAEDRLDVPPR